MGYELLDRIFKRSMMLSVLLGIVGAFYFGAARGIDFAFAGLWGTLNFRFLQYLIVETTQPSGPRIGKVVGSAAVKFPLLYGGGVAWLMLRHPDRVATIAGFSLVFAVTLLLALGRALIDSSLMTRTPAGSGEGR